MTAAHVGQPEGAPAAGFFGLDQPLVGKLLQGRVDGARAGPPGATAALFYLGHDLVPVARALAQQRQDRGTDITAAGLRPARKSGRPRPPAAPRPAGTARPVPDTAPDLTEKGVSTVSGIEGPGAGVSCW